MNDDLGGLRAIAARPDPKPTEARKRTKPNADGDNRPTITLIVGETEQAVNELEGLLIASDRGLYRRGGFIVSTGFAKMLTWDGKEVVGQVIEARGDYAIAEDAEAAAKFVRFDEKGNRHPCPPPMSLIRTLKDRKHFGLVWALGSRLYEIPLKHLRIACISDLHYGLLDGRLIEAS
jgi:hypothetical protein